MIWSVASESRIQETWGMVEDEFAEQVIGILAEFMKESTGLVVLV